MTTNSTHDAGEMLQADPDTFYATRDDGSCYRLAHGPTYLAPNCAGDILAHPPHIVRDSSEQPSLMLEGSNGIGPQREAIIKVARLTGRNQFGRYDVVLVLTEQGMYTMQGRDFDRQKRIDEIELAEQ